MKNLIVLLSIFLVLSQAYGQKKSKVDPKDAQIDTLAKKLDSVSKELVIFRGVYDTLVKKVVLYNFNPAKTSFLIDSLKMPRDAAYIKLSTTYADSLSALRKEYQAIKASVDFTNSETEKTKLFMTQEEIDKAKIVATLKQYKELVDAKVITEAEFIVLKKKYLEKL